jgi:AcrR family transcriptional regulator
VRVGYHPCMSKRFRLTPRKAPTQDRSKATVDAIMQATEKVLLEDGWDAANTNRVAEVAGVSIGSLYQYFPSKESLLASLWATLRDDMVGSIAEVMLELGDASLEDATEEIVGTMWAAYAERMPLMKIVVREGPMVDARRKLDRANQDLVGVLRGFVEKYGQRIDPVSSAATAYALAHSIDGVLLNGVLDRPDELPTTAFLDELQRLALGYLLGPRPGAS